jgi:hypothetical protein
LVDKDTWRHLDAGAAGTVAVAVDRTMLIRPTVAYSLEEALIEASREADLVLVEGFKGSSLPKILVASSLNEAKEQLSILHRVLAIYGKDLPVGENIDGVPILSDDEIASRLGAMVVEDLVKRLPGIDCGRCGYPSCKAMVKAILDGKTTLDSCKAMEEKDVSLIVDGIPIPLSGFPRELIRNVVVGMVRSLKGINLESIKHITLDVKLRSQHHQAGDS